MSLLTRYMIERMLMNRSRRRSGWGGYGRGYGRHRGYGRRPAGRGGFYGPFPHYSRRTRGGSRVMVSGSCLPIPLGMLATAAAGARLLKRR